MKKWSIKRLAIRQAEMGRPLNNPVMQALIGAKVSEMIEPPRSWGHAEKVAFLSLPPDLQRFYAKRETERDREVRRCQNDRAVALKKLATAEDRLERAEANPQRSSNQRKDMKISKSMTERIEEFRAEVNAFIDKEAAEQKKSFPALPPASIRNCITSGIGCACAAGLKVAETIEKERA